MNKKQFWNKMKTWEMRQKFLEELNKYFKTSDKVRIHFVSKKNIAIKNIISQKIQFDTPSNEIALQFLYKAVGEDLFYSFNKEFYNSEIVISAPQRQHLQLYLDYTHGVPYYKLQKDYNCSYSHARKIVHTMKTLYS